MKWAWTRGLSCLWASRGGRGCRTCRGGRGWEFSGNQRRRRGRRVEALGEVLREVLGEALGEAPGGAQRGTARDSGLLRCGRRREDGKIPRIMWRMSGTWWSGRGSAQPHGSAESRPRNWLVRSPLVGGGEPHGIWRMVCAFATEKSEKVGERAFCRNN